MEPELENLFRRMRRRAEATKKFKNTGKEWFIVSKYDFEIFKLLLREGYYAGSVYHLQQCYEKLSKAFFVLTGTAHPDIVYGHNFTHKRIKELFDESWAKDGLKLYEIVSERELEIKPELIDAIRENDEKIRKISKEETNKFLSFFNKLEDKFYNPEFIIKLEKKIKTKKKIKRIKHFIYVVARRRVKFSDVEKLITREAIEKEAKTILLSLKIMLLGILLFPHYNTPRYPKNENSEITFFSYKLGLGIVDTLKKFLKLTDEILKDFENEYELNLN